MTDQTLSFAVRAKRTRPEHHIAERICKARRTIQVARAEPDTLAFLSEAGFTKERLTTGLEWCKAAQTALASRQWALCSLEQARTALEKNQVDARQVYREYRAVARLLFRDHATRSALRLNEETPKDVRKFIALARSSYATALASLSYRCRLSQYGSLEAAQDSLAHLIEAEMAYRASQRAAQSAGERLTRVVASLNDWLSCFYDALQSCLTEHPDLLPRFNGNEESRIIS